MAYRDEVLADSPVGYWRLGETTGTNADDETANNRDGTYTNTPTLGVTGALNGDANKAVTFTAAQSEYVTIADNNAWSANTTLSVEAWAKVTSKTTLRAVVSKGAASNFEWVIYYHNGTDRWGATIYDPAGNTYVYNNTLGPAPSTSAWYHLVFTLDTTTDTLHFYINGSDVGASTIENGSLTYGNGTSPVNIGRRGDANWYFEGSVDEVAIYSTVLSPTRIQAHYDVGVGNVTVSVPVANIDVAGVAPTVTISETETPDVPNISVAGLDATVTTTFSLTIDAPVADIAVDGLNPSVSSGSAVTVTTDPTNVAVVGVAPDTEVIGFPDVADITMAGEPADVVYSAEIQAPTADISVAGVAPALTIYNTRFFRPTSDLIVTNISTSTVGVQASSMIDEPMPANDADYVWGTAYRGGNSPLLSVGIAPESPNTFQPPIQKSGHYVRFRYKTNGGDLQFTLRLRQETGGVGDIAVGTFPTSPTWTTGVIEITPQEASRITQWNQLVIWLSFAVPTGSAYTQGTGSISQTEFEVPPYDPGQAWVDVSPPGQTIVSAPSDVIFDNGVHGASVTAPTGNITIEGQPLSGLSTGNNVQIITDVVNIAVAAPTPSLGTGDLTDIGVEPGEITVVGLQSGLTTDRNIVFLADVVDVAVVGGGNEVRTGPDAVAFRFIPETYTGLTSADAVRLSGLEFGPLLHGQEKILRFRIGNDSAMTTHFLIGAVGSNPVTDMITFSPNGYAYASTILVESIPGNGVSDVVYMKMRVGADAFVSEGSVLVQVVQTVA